MSLKARLAEQIAAHGPLSVADYMQACLHDPEGGYYATRPALGEDGDFITAPLVSQMFGELVGVWALSVWREMGAPGPFRLVEVGPGDGTLIGDLLRAARLDPAFLAAIDLWLVEPSSPLRERQAAVVEAAGLTARWVDGLAAIPDGAPLILIANEVLDCLPVRQFVRTDKGWAERRVGLDESGELMFGLSASPGPVGVDAPVGSVFEVSAAQTAFGDEVAARVRRDTGAALLIDYGRDSAGFGDTLQALSRHQKVDPLAEPGAADLTVHADFPAVLAAARAEGVGAVIVSQQDFLIDLGIEARVSALARAGPEAAARIGRQLVRLIGDEQMGLLFKAACLYYPKTLSPPGFEDG